MYNPLYKHCEYHSFVALHVLPDAHTVAPVHPFPPHCPYFGAAATFVCVGGAELVEAAELAALLVTGLVVVPPLPLEGETTPPGPATEVVRLPDSM